MLTENTSLQSHQPHGPKYHWHVGSSWSFESYSDGVSSAPVAPPPPWSLLCDQDKLFVSKTHFLTLIFKVFVKTERDHVFEGHPEEVVPFQQVGAGRSGGATAATGTNAPGEPQAT